MQYQETEKVELKRELTESLSKEIVAFLNSMDGIIFIGVNDNGEPVGVPNLDETLRNVADIITTQIMPNPQEFVELGTVYENGVNIIKITIKKGKSLYYIKKYGRSVTGCFVRIGTSARSMTEEEIERKYAENVSIPERAIKDIPVLRDDYTFNKLKLYLVSGGVHINERNFYKNFDLITLNGEFNILADILADDNRNSIKVAVFNGTDKTEFIKRNEYGYTCLIESLEKVLNYCDALNETYIDLSVRPRKENRMFSSEAFKEAWINACVHNKWSENLSPAVYWYSDRLEIVSYGGIPKNLTKEEFLAGKTEPVNKELMKIFLQCGIVEHSGHGVPIVVREYGESAFTFSENMITVSIPFIKNKNLIKKSDIENGTVKIDDTENGTVNDTVNENDTVNDTVNLKNGTVNDTVNDTVNENDIVNDTVKLVYELIEKDNKITISKLMKQLKKSRRTITRAIFELKKQEKIKRIGSDKKGYWEII